MGTFVADDRLALHRIHYRLLARDCMDLSLGGFLVDEARRKELAAEVEVECRRLRGALRAATPFDLFGKGKRKGEEGKGLSNPKVASYFYDYLKCRAYIKRETGGRTCDEVTIRKLMRQYKKAQVVGTMILDFRMYQKRGSDFLAPDRTDDDGRFRALYWPGAKTGRLRSEENPLGTGFNGQNCPRPPSPVRSIFIPDRGHILLELDESQAEDRLVGGMSGDREMRRLALAGPEVDVHRLNAALIFDKEPEDITPEERQLGKRAKHAANYGMEGTRMSEVALLETEGALVLDPRQCDEWLAKLHKHRPGIPRYHQYISQQIISQGYLENSWGRRLYFRRLRLAKEDYKEGYAWPPQSEVGLLLNQWGFRPAMKLARKSDGQIRVVQQGHDSVVLSCDPAIAWDVAVELTDTLSQPREYAGAAGPWTLAMPIGYKLGHNWGAMAEFKARPKREEWEAAVEQVTRRTWWWKGTRARPRPLVA